jgi:prepilin-type N-terminal cleavage/methylation domain-containing protein
MSKRPALRGFSLIELLVAVAVLLTLAAIAVPTYLHARRSANEASAAASLRAIASGQMAYRNTHGRFTDLDGLRQAQMVDEALGGGTKSGYRFSSVPGGDPSLEFTAWAEPVSSSGLLATGGRSFFVSQDQAVSSQAGPLKVREGVDKSSSSD